MQRRVADIEKVGADRHMWPMLLQNAKRQEARTLRTFDSFDEVRPRQFFPADRQFGRRGRGLRLRELSYSEDRAQKGERRYTVIPATLAIHMRGHSASLFLRGF